MKRVKYRGGNYAVSEVSKVVKPRRVRVPHPTGYTFYVMFPRVDHENTTRDDGQAYVNRWSNSWVPFESDQKSGSTLPTYRYIIASLGDATTNYSRTAVDILEVTPHVVTSSVTLHVGQYRTKFESRYFGIQRFQPTVSMAGVDSSNEELQALHKVKQRLASKSAFAAAAVPLAELRDLRRTIVGTAEVGMKFIHAASSIRKDAFKGNVPRRIAQARKDMADAYLTYAFGIAPMVGDAKNISTNIAAILHQSARLVHATGKAERTWRTYSKYTNVASAYRCDDTIVVSGTHSLLVKFGSCIAPRVYAGNVYSAVDHFGLGLNSLPKVGWEWLPFSWIADYFANVSQYLDDVFYTNPGGTIYHYKDVKYVAEFREARESKEQKGTDPVFITQSNGLLAYRITQFNRTKLLSLPTSSLRFRSVDEVGKYAVEKLLNLTAVLAQRR